MQKEKKNYGYDKVAKGFKKVEPMRMSEMVPKMDHYPTFHVPIKSVPEAKDWKVGGSYKLFMEVVQRAVHMDDMRKEVTFEIRKIKAV